ncbi:hypothetical protein [Opitutus sp. GAS368]|uniref:hypothetical protein n=1 Tax=Opitutus sp. GAS368 TaxID=1882749 RepID=UPI00087D7F10|nr:hypothetical protein [Opitutus sp. GAS368]SDR75639.1 hypothetical protein SAMN05444173_0749 [Opitutus sp. GAS368]
MDTLLRSLGSAIKAGWTAHLKESSPAPPDAAALVNPEMLVFMLDETLARLCATLEKSPEPPRPRITATPFGRTRGSVHCGLQLLLIYYLAGARALREALPVELGPARVEVLHRFNRLAREEMIALCGACHHRGGASCQLATGLDFVRSRRRGQPVP